MCREVGPGTKDSKGFAGAKQVQEGETPAEQLDEEEECNAGMEYRGRFWHGVQGLDLGASVGGREMNG